MMRKRNASKPQGHRGLKHAELISRPLAEPLERRTLLSAVRWTGAVGDNLWTTPGNWSTNAVPGGNDEVTINVDGSPTITLNLSQSIHSLETAENLLVSNVTLAFSGGLTLSSNAQVRLFTENRFGFTTVAALDFRDGRQTLGGQGEVLFQGNPDKPGFIRSSHSADNEPASITIGQGVTVRTNGGAGVVGESVPQTSVVNHGSISADSANVPVTLAGSFVNDGVVRAVGGILEIRDRFSGTGALRVQGGSLNLKGRFTQADLGVFTHTGGLVNLSGTLTGGLALNASTGSWSLDGGTLAGGTYSAAGGAKLQIVKGVFDGVTIASNLTVDYVRPPAATLVVQNGLTLANNATFDLTLSTLEFRDGHQQLRGEGELVFGLSGNQATIRCVGSAADGPASLSIASTVTLRGTGTIGQENTPTSIISDALVVVEWTMAIQGNFINNGTVRIGSYSTGDTLDLYGGYGGGEIDLRNGMLNLRGSYTQAQLREIHRGSAGVVNLMGTLTGGLTLDTATGSWNLVGGKIVGGVYRASGGANLLITDPGSGGELKGMTIASDLVIDSAVVGVRDGLVLADNATIHLGVRSSRTGLEFRDGDQTLGGQGRVELVTGGLWPVRFSSTLPASLTIGPDIAVIKSSDATGILGDFDRPDPANSIINKGQIVCQSVLLIRGRFINAGTIVNQKGLRIIDPMENLASGAVVLRGGAMTFQDTFDNAGTVTASEGAVILETDKLSGPAGQFHNSGSLVLGAGTTFSIYAHCSFDTSGIVTFQVGGSAQSGQFGGISSSEPVTLGGAANVELVGGFHTTAGDVYPLVQARSIAGSFSTINGLVESGVTLFTQNLSQTQFSVTATGRSVEPAPHVTDVFVSSGRWTSDFTQTLAPRGLGESSYGYRLGAGVEALSSLPWMNLDRLSVRFDRPVDVQAGDLVIRGIRMATYPVATFAYDAETNTATWTVGAPFGADEVTFELNDGVTAAGNGRALDGDYFDILPTGDGTDGGDFRFPVNVLPGDANRSGGAVNAADLVLTRNRVGRTAQSLGSDNTYSIFTDLNGDGVTNASDLVLVRNRVGAALPPAPGFDYPNFSDATGLDFFGDAVLVGDAVRFVPASEHHSGAVRRQGGQDLSQGFSTSFTFRYANVGGILDDSGNHGTDGIAFTIQPTALLQPVTTPNSMWKPRDKNG